MNSTAIGQHLYAASHGASTVEVKDGSAQPTGGGLGEVWAVIQPTRVATGTARFAWLNP